MLAAGGLETPPTVLLLILAQERGSALACRRGSVVGGSAIGVGVTPCKQGQPSDSLCGAAQTPAHSAYWVPSLVAACSHTVMLVARGSEFMSPGSHQSKA